jgi:hypothetical protein
MGVAAFVRTRSIVTASASQGGGARRAVFVWVSQLLGWQGREHVRKLATQRHPTVKGETHTTNYVCILEAAERKANVVARAAFERRAMRARASRIDASD